MSCRIEPAEGRSARSASVLSRHCSRRRRSFVADRRRDRTAGPGGPGVPVFSHPTRITNPLFPITSTEHMISLGVEGETKLRQETTLLDRTRTISYNGKQVETIVSQFVAYGDGRILEVAIDYFAQADDGGSGTSAKT